MMRVSLLDFGYIELVETWGSEERIIEAARMSTGKGFLGWGSKSACSKCGLTEAQAKDQAVASGRARSFCEDGVSVGHDFKQSPGDEKLLRYLYENHHATPFEMAGAIFEVKAPIFVFREWHRHRTQSYNEMSARYTPLPDENYIPSVERLMVNGGANKQASSTGVELTPIYAERFRRQLASIYEEQQALYENALAVGVPKELARIHLPVGRYSRMRTSANLRNWLGFMTLRSDSRAQWEIRQYSQALGEMLTSVFPRTMSLFKETHT